MTAPVPARTPEIVPDVFFLEMTNHCNMHCTFCPSDYIKKDRALADDELAIRYIEQVRDLNLNRPIQFSVLGEPLLNKKIFNYIDLCEQYGIEVYLITNISLLDEERSRKIFAHDNIALVMSLQTPNKDSYDRLRGYDKLDFDEYFARILPALREKFASGSESRVEIHVTSTTNMRADSTLQSDFELDMWDPFKIEDKGEFVRQLLDRFDGYAEQLRAEYPDAFATELARSADKYGPQLERGHLAGRRADVPPNAEDLTEDRFWGYMFAPNCFIRFKSFGMWTKEESFMKTFLPKESLVYVEERQEPMDCAMAHNVSMLADGQLSLCCLDYEGEMELPNLRNSSLKELLEHPKRMEIAKNAMQTEVCRRCQGNLYVFDTRPSAMQETPVSKFGQGWYPYEAELNGTGGRWSSGNATCYHFARGEVQELGLKFFSVLDSDSAFKVSATPYDEISKSFGATTTHTFHGVQNSVAEVNVPLRLDAGKLYRLDFESPTWTPAAMHGSADTRELGFALLEAKARSVVANAGDAPAAVEPVAEKPPRRFRQWFAKFTSN